MLPDLHTGFSGGRSGGLVFPSLEEFPRFVAGPNSSHCFTQRGSRTNCSGPQTHKHPTLDLRLSCHHLEITYNFWKRSPGFLVCTESHKWCGQLRNRGWVNQMKGINLDCIRDIKSSARKNREPSFFPISVFHLTYRLFCICDFPKHSYWT